MPSRVPAGQATNKGQMLISCILARSLRASPHTLPSPISRSGFDIVLCAREESQLKKIMLAMPV